MEALSNLMTLDIGGGRTLGDVLTLDFLAQMVGSVIAAILLLFAAFIIGGWARRKIVKIALEREELDDTLFTFLGNLLRYVVLILAVVVVLNTFGVQTTSLVAAIGAAGLAIGLALQGTLSNVAAGVMIILFRPIKLGDFVSVAGVSGTVKDISLNTTELATLDNVQVIVPNAQVWGSVITNYSVYDTRRAEWTFGVSYGSNLATAEQVIRDTILSDPRALPEPEPFCQVNNLGDSSVDFLVRVWCASSDKFSFEADMKRQVKEALDKAGIDIPFPTQTLIQVSE
ncbi:mechanosensitive ion channel family protein [Nioella sediminis]|uniref:mechanosensitive ion channel family protein n=1 Tax=Nioella sediminis TaxID=1912092 RepID=UPI0008FD7B52|nr:mechanosensitive ion channel family protein [Nioella sediminis]TBX15140.1 mechanosensitive ion channel protein MscS [Roseovarius sp. JS7-11]